MRCSIVGVGCSEGAEREALAASCVGGCSAVVERETGHASPPTTTLAVGECGVIEKADEDKVGRQGNLRRGTDVAKTAAGEELPDVAVLEREIARGDELPDVSEEPEDPFGYACLGFDDSDA